MKKFLCVVMVIVWLGSSVMAWPVAAEVNVASNGSAFNLGVEKLIMGVGDVTYIDVTPVDVEPTWTSSSSSIASVDPITGVITAHKRGLATITATFVSSEGVTFQKQCSLQVLEKVDFFEENYYIEFQDSALVMFPVLNDTAVGPHIRLAGQSNLTTQKWLVEKVAHETYTIKSVASNMYIGVQANNSGWVTLYDHVNNYAKWRIYSYRSLEARGLYYVLAPYLGGIYSGRVLGVSSNEPSEAAYVGLFDFFNTNMGVEWDITCPNVYVDHYYDISIFNDSAIRNEIPFAHDFAQRIFMSCFGKNVVMNGSATYYDELTINECTCGVDSHCVNSTQHTEHHKYPGTYYDEVTEIDRCEKHIIVMWADRPDVAYCSANSLAFADADKRICFYTVRVDDQIFGVEYSACQIFAHELSHCFGMPDVYPDDDDETNNHTFSKGTQCIMNKILSADSYDFYQHLIQDDYANISTAYCISCYWQMYGYVNE